MPEKPILFSTDMVRAILDGRKTQTRRVIKPVAMGLRYGNGMPARVSQYQPGDILYVRETWKQYTTGTAGPGLIDGYLYKADDPQNTTRMMVEDRWHPSIHMPKSAARIFLKVTNVRAERLQSITEQDAIAEGCPPDLQYIGYTAVEWFHRLWNSIADVNTYWSANPWVWVYEFERVERNG